MFSILYKLKYTLITLGFIIMSASLLLICCMEKAWCFSQEGKVSGVETTANGADRRSIKVSTINVEDQRNRVVDGSEGVRRKNAQNSWQFQN